MYVIEPARLKKGVRLEDLAKTNESDSTGRPGMDDTGTIAGGDDALDAAAGALIRGTALIFHDPDRPGKKLDAIDTDQITPAKDCVSTSLEKLDERWKAGAFRYLMPDFRERLHGGENFIIAGDRFAIGSSREMSPAGLKAIADEAHLEMVILCGENMGDIFRRNALNLGLHVAQSVEAVADARDGDRFSFNTRTREITNETQGKKYAPIPLTDKEEEIRRSGGIFAVGRREFARSVAVKPVIEWPEGADAERLTTTEQIVWAHRVDRDAVVEPGGTFRLYADLLPASDGTAPFSIHTFNEITGGDTIRPRQLAIASDHFVFTGKEEDDLQTAISRQFVEEEGIGKPYIAEPGDGIFHFYFPEQGLVYPGQFIPGADSHTRTYGAYGALAIGVGSTALGFGWSTGYIHFTLAKQRRVTFTGSLRPWVSGKDIVLALLARWGKEQSKGMCVELVDAGAQLPICYRHTIANMMAEAEAQNGIFAPDEITVEWYRSRGMGEFPYPMIRPGKKAHYEIDETFDLGDVTPFIAKPSHPSNGADAEEVADEKIRFDKAYIGSCTNGAYDDLLQAALVIRAARDTGYAEAKCEFLVFPGSRGVALTIREADPRLGGESIASVFENAGGKIRESWCGPCFGQGPDALAEGERAIATFNRNWRNRMGIGGEGFLASPAVVASSALLGYMAPPARLGLEWDAKLFGV